jgi:uncharacterized membrane protein
MHHSLQFLEHATFAIGLLGVLVIVFGVSLGLCAFLRAEISVARGADPVIARHLLRQNLGYYLLLGLEFLIAADIIETLMKPTPRDLITLGAIVLIRTVISFSLNAELSAHLNRVQPVARP